MVYVALFTIYADVHLSYRYQIAGLIAMKISTKVSIEYINFTIVFFLDLASKLPEHITINNYAIELSND